jgi:integrase/recombinase XerD
MEHMQHLTPNEYHTLLKALPNSKHPMAPLIELIARTGMRSHELLLHRPEHIDLKNGMILIKAAKGSKDRLVPAPKVWLKTIVGREISVTNGESLKRMLRDAWERIRLEVFGHGYGAVTLHSLRASFAVALYQSTKDILLVQELLGHRALSSTMVYVRLVQGIERRGDVLKALNGRRVA